MVGVVLWQWGLTFVFVYGLYLGSWRLLALLAWPMQVTVGLALTAAGFGLVMLSLMLERVQASRREGNLTDD